MSTGRVLWIIWCCLWAGIWPVSAIDYYQRPANAVSCFLSGTACHGPGWVVSAGVLLGFVSLLAIRLPVGK